MSEKKHRLGYEAEKKITMAGISTLMKRSLGLDMNPNERSMVWDINPNEKCIALDISLNKKKHGLGY